ncbi:MAG TPA: hypothetical protein QGF35_07605 [Dehalococcoidia bacterium]|nr:hypothetical protein [Dehalococcoidia bacterium]
MVDTTEVRFPLRFTDHLFTPTARADARGVDEIKPASVNVVDY